MISQNEAGTGMDAAQIQTKVVGNGSDLGSRKAAVLPCFSLHSLSLGVSGGQSFKCLAHLMSFDPEGSDNLITWHRSMNDSFY